MMDSQVKKVKDSFEVEVQVLYDLAGGCFVKGVGEDGSRLMFWYLPVSEELVESTM